MNKIKVSQVVVVEGKYDAIKLDSIVEGLIIPVHGFTVYSDEEKKNLLKQLGKKNGIILITDSDSAGFRIRNYVQNICRGSEIINVYIPPVQGKESRKQSPSKEGLLGVEGIDKDVLVKCLEQAGVNGTYSEQDTPKMTYTDLFELGLSGTENATRNREKLAKHLNIPTKLSKKALLEVLNRMCTKTEIENILNEKPVLFWDFHGTLTKPDNQWVDIALKLSDTMYPEMKISHEAIKSNLYGKCLPWWTYPDRDTRHLMENDGWWKSCEDEFVKMYIASGFEKHQAEKMAPLIRLYVVDINNHRLHDDALAVLSQLKERGYKNYILSNNFPELPQMVKDIGLDKYFDGCVVSAKIGFAKPRKEIFEYARNLAGNPEKCIMIGDNPVDDIKGAKENGFDTMLVNNRHPEYNGDYCDYICKTLTDMLNILK
ncbi:MAG: HAD-IA family hydrolase [Oscillospiraceae bacterium]|nr:HAD-IA family hydrolase [Oscillospiraceae bacterium]